MVKTEAEKRFELMKQASPEVVRHALVEMADWFGYAVPSQLGEVAR